MSRSLAKLGEGRKLAYWREVEAQPPGNLPHRLHLGRAADARNREAPVHRRPDALVEAVRLEEYLAVGDRDDVGRDVGRYVAGLRLDDRQRRQRAAAFLVPELCRAFEEPRVQVEDVARERLAARRTPQQERDLAVGLGVLRQVVVDAERVAARVAEVLAHGARGIRAEVQHRRRVGSDGSHDDRVAHRVVVFERLDDLRHRRRLLTYRVVDADEVLVALVDDRVHGDRGLAGLAVADDQLALAAANRDERVDCLEARLHRLAHRLPVDDARREALDRGEALRGDRPLAVYGLAERVDHAADHLLAHRHRDDAPGPLDRVALLDLGVLAEEHDADAVLLEVERQAEHAVRELEHLACHGAVHAVHAGDAVAH